MSHKSKTKAEIPSISDISRKSSAEAFQNTVLRPIIKTLHELIIAHIEHHPKVRKAGITGVTSEERDELIRAIFLKDHRFKAEIKGMVLGSMTIEEYQTYLGHAAENNRRVFTMIAERVASVYR